MVMDLRDRIGLGNLENQGLEEGLNWAAANGFHFADVCVDKEFASFPGERIREVRKTCERHGIHLGLHTLSAVNIAETSPFVSEAVDQYLRAYIDLSKRLGCGWIVVHAGYHFKSDFRARQSAALEHLKRAVEYAERNKVLLLLENMNWEPDDAEIHYLGHTLEEFSYYLKAISSTNMRWAFTVNHAHLVPEGIDGFLNVLGLDRCEEVRLADNKGDKEQHLKIGQGNINFTKLFRRLESSGFKGHYMMSLKLFEDMREGRDYLVDLAGKSI
jgi:sugar phosphate isomerase/epimerase